MPRTDSVPVHQDGSEDHLRVAALRALTGMRF